MSHSDLRELNRMSGVFRVHLKRSEFVENIEHNLQRILFIP